MKKKYDDGLEWLREIRHGVAKQFNYDPKLVGDYYRNLARSPEVKPEPRGKRPVAKRR